jgi:hypothetical protein
VNNNEGEITRPVLAVGMPCMLLISQKRAVDNMFRNYYKIKCLGTTVTALTTVTTVARVTIRSEVQS